MLKNSSTLAVSLPINISIKLGFISVNGPRELTVWTRYVVPEKSWIFTSTILTLASFWAFGWDNG